MNVPWPLLGLVAAGYTAAGILAIGAQIGATRRRRTGGRPAPGDGHQTPAPGQRTTRYEAASPPTRPTPAPGFIPPDIHIELWVDCGRSRVYNSAGETVGGRDCGCPVHNDWDTALREELTP